MREQINENPIAQAVLVGILLLGCVFLLYTRVIAGDSSEPAEPAATAPTDAATGAPATPSAAAPSGASAATPAAPDGTSAAPTAPVPGAPATVSGKLEAGKGMPQGVVDAYEAGDAVVLLIVKQSGVDDKRVKSYVRLLELDPDVEVFVTGAKNVARYSQIANGVGVSRVPALIVVQPRKVSDVPTASVSYGFRSPQSVVQAVKDALYKGKNVPYYPE